MSDEEGDKVYFPTGMNEDCDELSLIVKNAPSCSNIRFDLPSLELPSPISLQETSPLDPRSLCGSGEGSKRKHAEYTLQMQTSTQCHEDVAVAEQDLESNGECRRQKRPRSTEIHNLNERLRRQKLKEKMKDLQELIPNCNKRNISSILDDAIKYMNTLQYQIQMLSTGAGHTMFHSPLMIPQSGQQGMPFPSFSPNVGTCPRPGIGTGHGIGIEIPGPSSSFNMPTGPFGLPHPCLMASTPSIVQNPGNILESSPFTASFMDWDPFSLSTNRGETSQSQGIPITKNEPVINEQSAKEGSTVRVLPSRLVLSDGVKDYGSSNSGSSLVVQPQNQKTHVAKTSKW